jgi:hypothetical protein
MSITELSPSNKCQFVTDNNDLNQHNLPVCKLLLHELTERSEKKILDDMFLCILANYFPYL